MNILLTLLLALPGPARANVKASIPQVGTLPAGISPVVGASAPMILAPAQTVLTAPALAPSLLTAPAPLQPALAAPDTPAPTAAGSLEALGQSLAAPADGAPADAAPALGSAFDGTGISAAPAGDVSVAAAPADAPRGSDLEKPDHARISRAPESILKTRLWEAAEVGVYSVPFHVVQLMSSGFVASLDKPLAVLLTGALWAGYAWAGMDHIARLRSRIVGGWQASHDQKYRVDVNTGKLKDVRGHKYGEDRYDEWQKGPVGPAARVIVGAAALGMAAAWLSALL